MTRTLWWAVAAGVLLQHSLFAQSAQSAQSVKDSRLTARQVIERIQKNVGVPWRSQTVDTFKAGDPDTPVTGVATTMMATFDVLERAAASGNNLIITHEPTFYGHLDQTGDLAGEHQASDMTGGDDLSVHLEQRVHDGVKARIRGEQPRVALRLVAEAKVLADRHPRGPERAHQHISHELIGRL